MTIVRIILVYAVLSLLASDVYSQTSEIQARVKWEKAKISLENEKYGEALKAFEEVIGILGPFPELLYNAARSAYRVRQYEKAQDYIQRVLITDDREFKESPEYQDAFKLAAEIEIGLDKFRIEEKNRLEREARLEKERLNKERLEREEERKKEHWRRDLTGFWTTSSGKVRVYVDHSSADFVAYLMHNHPDNRNYYTKYYKGDKYFWKRSYSNEIARYERFSKKTVDKYSRALDRSTKLRNWGTYTISEDGKKIVVRFEDSNRVETETVRDLWGKAIGKIQKVTSNGKPYTNTWYRDTDNDKPYKLDNIRLYKGSIDDLSANNPYYTDRFESLNLSWVFCRIELDNLVGGIIAVNDVAYEFNCYDANDTIIHVKKGTLAELDSGGVIITARLGYDAPGQWKAGKYRVIIKLDTFEVGSIDFTVN